MTEVAAQVFTRPPWAEPRQSASAVAERLAADTLRPGFALAVAFHDDQVHGFAYGVRCSRLALRASRLPRGDVTLRELAVSPAMQGRGLGVRLHDALLSASPGASWWLATHPRPGRRTGRTTYRACPARKGRPAARQGQADDPLTSSTSCADGLLPRVAGQRRAMRAGPFHAGSVHLPIELTPPAFGLAVRLAECRAARL
ncbi:GNAT family N-acetyltransferase, partial [Nonomuraea wenchangensis]|uniref:GNAT family N-acetyltransferase n=1 Tax=Nonomuraea wenchangensis TaxID=568860 RepID=UPI003318BC33